MPTHRGPATGSQRWDGFDLSKFGLSRIVPCGSWTFPTHGLPGFGPDRSQNIRKVYFLEIETGS
jgi:hypothetical protein